MRTDSAKRKAEIVAEDVILEYFTPARFELKVVTTGPGWIC
jgi:hypothetical protein